MRTFSLTVETDNAAFDGWPAWELARILREVAGKLEAGPGPVPFSFSVRDVNGCRCGEVRGE